MTTTHGGARTGAGRPRQEGRRIIAILPDDLLAVAQDLGGGNVSAGVREALRRCAAHGLRRVEIWQHRTSRERYAVLVDRGRPVAASGPIDLMRAVEIMRGQGDIAWDEAQADAINEQEEAADDQAYRRTWPDPSA